MNVDNMLWDAPKRMGTAYGLLVLIGWTGAHRFYINQVGMGFLYLFTLGFLGVGVIVDAFLLAEKVDRVNRQIAAEQANLPRVSAQSGGEQ